VGGWKKASGGDLPLTSLPTGGTISSSGYYDNIGATAPIVLTFAATPGIRAVITRVDSYAVRIAPVAGSQVLWSGGRMAVDEYLEIGSDFGVLTCIVNPASDVQVTSEFGAISEETP